MSPSMRTMTDARIGSILRHAERSCDGTLRPARKQGPVKMGVSRERREFRGEREPNGCTGRGGVTGVWGRGTCRIRTKPQTVGWQRVPVLTMG